MTLRRLTTGVNKSAISQTTISNIRDNEVSVIGSGFIHHGCVFVGDALMFSMRSGYIFQFSFNADKQGFNGIYPRDYSLPGSVWGSNSGSQSKSTKRFGCVNKYSQEPEIKHERQTLKNNKEQNKDQKRGQRKMQI